MHVKQLLGHKSIQNTLIYINLDKAIFQNTQDYEFTVRLADNVEEACALIEVGFEYVTGENKDGGKIFRKRKRRKPKKKLWGSVKRNRVYLKPFLLIIKK